MTDEEWDAVVNVHLTGYWNVSRAAAAHFRDAQRGRFVHFTSTSGLIGNFGQANHAAAGDASWVCPSRLRLTWRASMSVPTALRRLPGAA